MYRIRAGSQTHIEWEVFDYTVTPAVQVDPDTAELYVIDPEGTETGPFTMTQIAVGSYKYLLQTTTDGPLGVWEAYMRVVKDGAPVLAEPVGCFLLV